MLTGTTSSGFHWQIEPDALDDMELLDALTEFDKGRQEEVSGICLHLLGKKQRAALYDHRRDASGRVRMSDISNDIGDILLALNEGPKS